MKKVLGLASSLVLGCVILAAAAGSSSAAAEPLSAHQEPILGHLLLPGDRLTFTYKVETPGIKSPTGSLYVRNDSMRGFERLALTLKRGPVLQTMVPARLMRGEKLLYYAVVRDPKSGRSVKVPFAGARAPDFAFILRKPRLVRLGIHRFGHTRAPEAVVARAGADEVGFENSDEFHFGPQTFLVGPDRSIWLSDGLNQRLLAWRPGRPDEVWRSVPLPFFAGDSDFALGPADTFYVLRGVRDPDPRVVLGRVSTTGQVWQSELGGGISDRTGDLAINTALRVGPDGTLYAVLGRPGSMGGERGWRPVATAAGRPMSVAAQRRGDVWPYQPVAGGLRLLSEVYTAHVDTAPHEARFALIDRRGRVVRAWRVLSRTDINFGYATPELVGGDPVVVLDATAPIGGDFKWEYVVLRLGPRGTRARFSLSRAVWGDNLLADVRVGPDGKLYQLASSPTTGVVISRYSLGPRPNPLRPS